jgi:small redox-active disulfide protein 2
MKIQVAGPGCLNCKTTERNVFNACAELNLDADISHVYDIREFAGLGVMRTPAVLVDGVIVMAGRVPTVAELKALLVKKQG